MDYEEALLLIAILFVIVLPFVLCLEVIEDLFINTFQQVIKGTVTPFRDYTPPEYRDEFDAKIGLLLTMIPIVITIFGIAQLYVKFRW